MALCNSCVFYDKAYHEFVARYEDSDSEIDNKREKDHCRMYSDFIPYDITCENGNCRYYEKE